MPIFLDTRGNNPISIGICARCGCKFPTPELLSDPNAPGLLVCRDDLDQYDPWRLPPRQTEKISIDNPRPDVALVPGPIAVPAVPIDLSTPVSTIYPSAPWQPDTPYAVGDQVTAIDPYGLDADLKTLSQYRCVVAGTSGAVAPNWPDSAGVEFSDGTVSWINFGPFLP